MSKEEAVKHWLRSAERDRQTAQDLFTSKNFSWSLFIWQLVIEKTLKAIIVQKDKEILTIHNLIRLAEYADLDLSSRTREILSEITTFNLEARYDDIKEEFYKKANEKYTTEWIAKAEEILQWLKNQT